MVTGAFFTGEENLIMILLHFWLFLRKGWFPKLSLPYQGSQISLNQLVLSKYLYLHFSSWLRRCIHQRIELSGANSGLFGTRRILVQLVQIASVYRPITHNDYHVFAVNYLFFVTVTVTTRGRKNHCTNYTLQAVAYNSACSGNESHSPPCPVTTALGRRCLPFPQYLLLSPHLSQWLYSYVINVILYNGH